VAEPGQHVGDELTHVGLVVDDEDAADPLEGPIGMSMWRHRPLQFAPVPAKGTARVRSVPAWPVDRALTC
jgi:hypothetical protein